MILSRAGHQQWGAWLVLSITTGLVILVYLSLSLSVSADPLLMPLDDTYIHFQYARQLADGQPMVYHDGDPATSGGTSLIYPPLLALGYRLGFTGWSLAYWALALGAISFFGSVWLVYQIARVNPYVPGQPDQDRHALWLALAFALSGPFVWAALSGMETALFVFTVLLALYLLQCGYFRAALLAAALMVITRPEGLILAGIAAVVLALSLPSWRNRVRRAGWLLLPLLAALIQPVINLAATGSLSSSGMVAKSHLYNSSVPVEDRLRTILEFWWCMSQELVSGYSADFGRLTPFLLAMVALAGLGAFSYSAWNYRRAWLPALVLVWIVALTGAVSTLDTAFWQFRRYQLPVMALFFPAAAWVTAPLGDYLVRRFRWRGLRWVLPALFLISSVLITVAFAGSYAGNVRVVRDQQVPMARWVKANLPNDARTGVHDVGLMGYFSGRALYDVVGLTTPGPAESWRQGPGAIYEHMASSDYRPNYFAIYPDVQGLSYLRDAGVLGEVLAEFPVDLPAHNVASAADYQAVYAADWSNTRAEEQIAQATTLNYMAGMTLVDQIDVANLDSEAAHDYRWWQDETPPGFVTEVYKNVYQACGSDNEADCWATDGGRVLTGGEEFTIKTIPGQDLLLVTRAHGRESVPLTIAVNGQTIDRQIQPTVPARWIEIVTLVPGVQITGARTRIRITTDESALVYSPYQHWAFQGNFPSAEASESDAVAEWDDPRGEILLLRDSIEQTPSAVNVQLMWKRLPETPDDSPLRDGVVFIHLYNKGNIDTEPVQQLVERPGGGALPPENWLPGVVEDTYTLALPNDLPPGDYVVAVGLFDARTGARYAIKSDQLMVDDNRLFIGEVTIEESAQ